MKIIGIIQARMSSTRLPGKVMLEAVGKPLILHVLERVSRCRYLDEIWLATSEHGSDDTLATRVEAEGYKVFRGSLQNVLSRFWQIAKRREADAVVRLTGDCPLHDPDLIDSVIRYFLENRGEVDYVSNVLPPTYPDGLDTEVFSFPVLDLAYHNATAAYDLEHVVPFIRRKSGDAGRSANLVGPADFSHLRWTLDEPEDYLLIKAIYEDLYPGKTDFGWLDVVAWMTGDAERLAVNTMHVRNEGSNEGPENREDTI